MVKLPLCYRINICSHKLGALFHYSDLHFMLQNLSIRLLFFLKVSVLKISSLTVILAMLFMLLLFAIFTA